MRSTGILPMFFYFCFFVIPAQAGIQFFCFFFCFY